MIVFLSKDASISWVHKYHNAYLSNTLNSSQNKILRKYTSIDSFCEHIQEVTPREKRSIQTAIQSIQQKCWTWKCLVARPTWTVIGVDNQVDGSMPHTIHSAIIMPHWLRAQLCDSTHSAAYTDAIETLIHEQIHCLQKMYPPHFDKLYTLWGYKQLHHYPHYEHTIRDLKQQFPQRTNPDTPTEWVLRNKWYQAVVFKDAPTSLTDVSYVLIDLQGYAADVSDRKQHAMVNQDATSWFTDLFGTTKHCYHPDETSAVLLANLIYQDFEKCASASSAKRKQPPGKTSPAEDILIKWVHSCDRL
jgi:hypothetical protein